MTRSTTLPRPAGSVGRAARTADPRAVRARTIAIALLGLLTYAVVLGAVWWTMLHVLPDQLSLRLAGRSFTLREIHHRIVSNGLLVFVLLPFAFWVESASVGWEDSSIRKMVSDRTLSIKTDLAVFVLGQAHLLDVLGRLMMLGASMVSGLWIRDYVARTLGVSIDLAFLPLGLQVVIYAFVYSFFDYWTHRLDHSHYFWPLHRYHHSAQDFCVLTAGRQHPAAFTATFLINVPLAVLGATPAVMIYVNVLVIALGFLIHSRIDSNWGWIGRYVVQSPVHHRLHHQLDYQTVPTGHFAMAPIWDHLFGTWRGEADQSLVIGVDTPYRHGFWVAPDLLRDYADFWKGFVTRRPNRT